MNKDKNQVFCCTNRKRIVTVQISENVIKILTSVIDTKIFSGD